MLSGWLVGCSMLSMLYWQYVDRRSRSTYTWWKSWKCNTRPTWIRREWKYVAVFYDNWCFLCSFGEVFHIFHCLSSANWLPASAEMPTFPLPAYNIILPMYSVLWYCWLGRLTCKNRLPYNLYCVGGDVKHYTINQSMYSVIPFKSVS